MPRRYLPGQTVNDFLDTAVVSNSSFGESVIRAELALQGLTAELPDGARGAKQCEAPAPCASADATAREASPEHRGG